MTTYYILFIKSFKHMSLLKIYNHDEDMVTHILQKRCS